MVENDDDVRKTFCHPLAASRSACRRGGIDVEEMQTPREVES
jgi:hypothetical protein